MDLKELYKKETGKDVTGDSVHIKAIISRDYLEWLEKQLLLHVVRPRLIANKDYLEFDVKLLEEGYEYEVLAKYQDLYCVVDETGDLEVFHKSFFNVA